MNAMTAVTVNETAVVARARRAIHAKNDGIRVEGRYVLHIHYLVRQIRRQRSNMSNAIPAEIGVGGTPEVLVGFSPWDSDSVKQLFAPGEILSLTNVILVALVA
jgi:hypothetical protein